MAKFKNNLLFLIALAAFLIVTPLLVLSAQGFRWNSAGGRLDRIGGILIIAQPPSALVTVSQQDEPIKSARVNRLIDGLFPGPYEVVVAATGYATWSRTLVVEPARVTRIEHVALLPTQPPAALVARLPNINALSVSPGGEAALAQTDPDYFYLLNFKRGDLWRVVINNAAADLDITTVNWLETNPPTFLALADNALNRYTFEEASGQLTAAALAPDIAAFSVAENKIYALALKAKTISEIQADGTRALITALPARPAAQGPTRLTVLNSDTALVLISGELQKIDLKTGKASSLAAGVTSFALSPDASGRLLYAASKTLAALNLNDETPPYSLLKNLVEPIDQIFLADDRAHAFVFQDHTLTFLETGPAEPRYQAKLAQTLKPLTFLAKDNQLFAAMLYADNQAGLFVLSL